MLHEIVIAKPKSTKGNTSFLRSNMSAIIVIMPVSARVKSSFISADRHLDGKYFINKIDCIVINGTRIGRIFFDLNGTQIGWMRLIFSDFFYFNNHFNLKEKSDKINFIRKICVPFIKREIRINPFHP